MPKITSFMVGIVLISFIMTVFGLFLAETNENYGITYDNESIAIYNQLDNISTLTQQIDKGSDLEERTGVLDIIGSYFTGAYNVLKLTKNSFNTFDTMSNRAVKDANLGSVGDALRVAIGAVVLILIILGVIISAVIKRDL